MARPKGSRHAGSVLAWAWLVAMPTLAARAAASHRFSADDWSALRSARAVAVAPSGHQVLVRVDRGGPSGTDQHEWYWLDTQSHQRQLLWLPAEFTPLGVTADGSSLYGLAAQNGRWQPAIRSPSGRLHVLTALPRGARAMRLSPDGTRFALLADPRPLDPLAGLRIVFQPEQSSLYVVHADGTGGAWWCPELSEVREFSWSPTGDAVATLSRPAWPSASQPARAAVHVCTEAGSRRVAALPAAAAGLAWNGARELVFLSTTPPAMLPDHLWSVALPNGTPRDRTPGLAGSVLAVTHDPRGTVWALVARGVQNQVAELTPQGLQTRYAWPPGTIEALPVFSELTVAPAVLAFTVSDPAHIANVALVGRTGQLERVTEEGDARLAEVTLGSMDLVSWRARNGTILEALVTFPPDHRPAQRRPLLLMLHDGPHAHDLLHLDPLAQLFAAAGYIVLQPQYRGSLGYGTTFLEPIGPSWLDHAAADLMSTADYAIARGWADPERLAVFGWGAGGSVAIWALTQSNRFRAAIVGGAASDWYSLSLAEGSGWWRAELHPLGGDPVAALRFSPLQRADRITTPLLLLHGEADRHIPLAQSLALFHRLAERNQPVQLVLYPGAPHWPARWEQRRDLWQQALAWLEKYLR